MNAWCVFIAASDLSAFDELLSGSFLVAQLSFPRIQGRGLQGTTVGEGQGPRLGQRTVVNRIKVHAGLLFRLAAWQECHSWGEKTAQEKVISSVTTLGKDWNCILFHQTCLKKVFSNQIPKQRQLRKARWCLTCDGRRHSSAQGSDGSHGDLLAAVLDGAGMSSCNHVGFQQSALKVHMVVWQSFIHCS